MTISLHDHAAARQIECPRCKAGPSCACIGLAAPNTSHVARVTLYLVSTRPEPDAACDAALLEVTGQRDDAKPFVHWLDGKHDFRTASSTGSGTLALRVFLAPDKPVGTVRRALLDVAIRHGLVISASEGGRGRWIVTDRGITYHRKHTT